MNEVVEIAAGSGPKRYDPNARTPHHHLVCQQCGSLRDLFFEQDVTPTLDDNLRAGFVVTGVEMVFQGICPQCAAHSAPGTDVGAIRA